MDDYRDVNRESWNARVDSHFASAFYDVPGFIAGRDPLNAPELALLGDVSGKTILHLQCHFGQDTIALARRGARVTGVDIADAAIAKARELNAACGTDATFLASDVYDLPAALDGRFDIVFSSYGTIGWLPDLDRWAGIVRRCLAPGGAFVFAEFHPVVWMFDDTFTEIRYRYFTGEAIEESQTGTYADRDAPLELRTVSWNHGLAEVVTALLRQGLRLTHFEELDHSPYGCFEGVSEVAPGRFRITKFGDKVPLVYTLRAVAPG